MVVQQNFYPKSIHFYIQTDIYNPTERFLYFAKQIFCTPAGDFLDSVKKAANLFL